MKPFEVNEINNKLRDANDNPIEIPPVPNDGVLERLTIQTINDSDMEQVRLISNIAEEIDEDDEGWKFSDVPSKVTKLTVEKIMIELTGESWFDIDKEDGYSAGDIIEMLSQKAFVQLSELTIANIKACLENGGKIIAYFPDLVWREYFNQLSHLPSEVLGMRTVEIVKVLDDNAILINDLSSADGGKKRLDTTAFTWLAKDGWMLEVYK